MKILIVSTFFPPLNSIASHRPYSWAKYWSLAGHDVHVLTSSKKIEKGSEVEFENPGFQIIEAPMPSFVNAIKQTYNAEKQQTDKGFWKESLLKVYKHLRYKKGILNACRMPDWSDLWIAPALKAVEKKGMWDLVVSTSGPYAVHFIGRSLKKRGLAKKWIADFRDPWSDNHIYPGLFPFNRMERHLEKFAMASADAITSVSPPIVDSLGGRHGRFKVHLIENGFDLADMHSLPKEPYFADNKFRIVHTGTIYWKKQNPLPLFEALKSICEKEESLASKLEVLFAGPNLEEVSHLTARYGVGSIVKTKGFIPRKEALWMQRDAHALLFFPWNETDKNGAGVTTGKIFEYFFSGTPLLAVGGKEAEQSQKMITDYSAGWVLPTAPDIEAFLLGKISNLAKEPSKIPPGVLDCYTRENLAKKMLELSL